MVVVSLLPTAIAATLLTVVVASGIVPVSGVFASVAAASAGATATIVVGDFLVLFCVEAVVVIALAVAAVLRVLIVVILIVVGALVPAGW